MGIASIFKISDCKELLIAIKIGSLRIKPTKGTLKIIKIKMSKEFQRTYMRAIK